MEVGAPGRLIVLDTETTGTSPQEDRIVEFFALEVDCALRPASSWRQRFNPGMPIPPPATAVHGIRDEDVAHEPPFQQHAVQIQRLLDGAILVAFNGLSFDLPLLHRELVRAGEVGLPVNPAVIDPYRLFQQDFPRTLSGAVQQYLGRSHDTAHSADGDVQATLDVLRVQWARRHAQAPSVVDLVHREEKHWLDHDRCFYFDTEADVIRFGFGKHRGQPARQQPGYLHWMLRQGFGPTTNEIARGLLAEART